MLTPFQTLFAVPLSCQSCVEAINTSLAQIDGVTKVDASLATQLVSIEGTAAPSAIAAAIKATGRDAVLRGTGSSNTAAVCILETHAPNVPEPVRGLARIVQVSPSLTLIDLSIRGISPGTYFASVRESGDISRGEASTGGVWGYISSRLGTTEPARGVLGTVWEVLGRSMVISRSLEGSQQEVDPDTLVGVIARSAGVWDNDKTVCSCSGKTLWEERKENVERGML